MNAGSGPFRATGLIRRKAAIRLGPDVDLTVGVMTETQVDMG